MTAHSNYGPSGMSRIIACPGSVIQTEGMESASSPAAQAGSLQHEYIADILLGKPVTILDEDHKCNVGEALDYYRSVHAAFEEQCDVEIEQQVSLASWGLPEVWGTADVILRGESHIDVIDWKFGSGVLVTALNNAQGLCYAAGAVGYPSGIETITIHIVQPPRDNYSVWEITMQELEDWVFGTLQPAIEDSKSPVPTFNPGEEQCRWCLAALNCRARHEQHSMEAAEIFSTTPDRISDLTDEDMSELMRKIESVLPYYNDMLAYAKAKLEGGEEFPGYVLTPGRKTRTWTDEKEVLSFLRNIDSSKKWEITKLCSPAQAEKLMKALKKNDDFLDLIQVKAGKPKLVRGGE
jgi:hypothetical protein